MVDKKQVSLEELRKQGKLLQDAFEQAQKDKIKTQTSHDEAKLALVTFNNEYGRVLRLLEEE